MLPMTSPPAGPPVRRIVLVPPAPRGRAADAVSAATASPACGWRAATCPPTSASPTSSGCTTDLLPAPPAGALGRPGGRRAVSTAGLRPGSSLRARCTTRSHTRSPSGSAVSTLGKRVLAWVIIAAAVVLALKLLAGVVIGLVTAVFTIALVVAVIVGVIWALRRL